MNIILNLTIKRRWFDMISSGSARFIPNGESRPTGRTSQSYSAMFWCEALTPRSR